nr:hypothetical protein [Tanacetum cinerariifolium]
RLIGAEVLIMYDMFTVFLVMGMICGYEWICSFIAESAGTICIMDNDGNSISTNCPCYANMDYDKGHLMCKNVIEQNVSLWFKGKAIHSRVNVDVASSFYNGKLVSPGNTSCLLSMRNLVNKFYSRWSNKYTCITGYCIDSVGPVQQILIVLGFGYLVRYATKESWYVTANMTQAGMMDDLMSMLKKTIERRYGDGVLVEPAVVLVDPSSTSTGRTALAVESVFEDGGIKEVNLACLLYTKKDDKLVAMAA